MDWNTCDSAKWYEEVSWRLEEKADLGEKKIERSGMTEESDIRSEGKRGPLKRVGEKDEVFSRWNLGLTRV